MRTVSTANLNKSIIANSKTNAVRTNINHIAA